MKRNFMKSCLIEGPDEEEPAGKELDEEEPD